MNRLIAAIAAGLILATVAVWSPDGEVNVIVNDAHAQVDDVPDRSLAILLSILVPGLLQILYTDEASTGLIYLIIAVVGYAIISAVFVIPLAFRLGYLIALLFWIGVGWFAWIKAEPKMYGGSPARLDDGADGTAPAFKEAMLPIAMTPRILYNGELVPAQ